MKRIALALFLIHLVFLCVFVTQTWAVSYTFTSLDVPGALSTTAKGINNVGQIVGTYGHSDGVLTWDIPYVLSGGSFVPISERFLTAPFASGSSSANDINDAGQIVGHFGDGNYLLPLADTSVPNSVDLLSTYGILFHTPYSGLGQQANGINNNGQVVVATDLVPGVHSFLYDSGTHALTNLDSLLGRVLTPLDINDSGAILAGGFLFDQGMVTAIAFPGAFSTVLSQLNNAGDIVGSFTDTGGTTHGFIFSQGQYSEVDVPGARTTSTWGINDLGWIVGSFTDADGQHGFLGMPEALTPEPQTFMLFGGGLLLLIRRISAQRPRPTYRVPS